VQIWPASIAAARLLARVDLRGKRVLDLGCGIGIPGIAAVRGHALTTFADMQADALAFAKWNASRHCSEGAVATVQQDWSQSVVSGVFDVIVLADVSYRPIHHISLQRHLSACLAPGGVILHADPVRRESTPFVRQLQARFHTQTVMRPTAFEERRLDIRLCVGSASPTGLDGWHLALGAIPAPQAPEGPSVPSRSTAPSAGGADSPEAR
jgi:predicted nicotinamide N-methyase